MSLSIRRRVPRAESAGWQWPEDLHPILRQVYERRNLSAPEDLNLALAGIAPVGSFDVLQSAVELLLVHRNGRIVIAGDYDSDGATSTALMLLCLRELGFADVRYFIPDRFKLGYGLSVGAVEQIALLEADLIVTVDNGIGSLAGIKAARGAGIDVLVTDHHVPPDHLPEANVIVNPNLPGTDFPGQHLAGVGVAFYVLAALGRALDTPAIVTRYLDLVALGTVADLVRLDRGNRILVQQGLARIRAGHCRPGIQALCEAANARLDNVTAETLAYQIGPRLNAAGRLEEMSIGVECLLTQSQSQANTYARRLDQLNRSRRDIEATMRAQAMEIVDSLAIEASDSRRILVLEHQDWHEGIVGLIASRVRERSGFPSFAFAPATNGLKGSGRSVAGFHLRDALAEVDALHPGVIDHFGGHAMAAGLSLQPDMLGEFTSAIEEVAARRVDDEALRRVLHTDGELESQYLSIDSAAAIRAGGPWGQGFPEPMFDGEFAIRSWRWLKDIHLSLQLEAPDGMAVEAIAFNSEFTEPESGGRIRAAYRLSVNDYFGDSRLQLIVEHCEPLV